MSLDDIKADIRAVIDEKKCGPIFIRLSWHDAGVYSTGKLTGGEFLMVHDLISCISSRYMLSCVVSSPTQSCSHPMPNLALPFPPPSPTRPT